MEREADLTLCVHQPDILEPDILEPDFSGLIFRAWFFGPDFLGLIFWAWFYDTSNPTECGI